MRAPFLLGWLVVACGGASTSDGVPQPAPSSPPITTPPLPSTPPPITLDDTSARGRSLAVDDAHVFLSSEDRGLVRIPALLGASPVPLSSGFFGAVALDPASIYSSRNQTLVRVPKDGGTETVLVTIPDAYWGPVRVSGQRVYFVSFTMTGGLERTQSHCTLQTISTDGGAPSTLLTYDTCGDFVVDENAVYAVRANDLVKIRIDGGAVTTLATLGQDILNLAQDDARIWVSALHTKQIVSVPKAGGAVELALTTPGLPTSLVADGADLVWLELPADFGGRARADVVIAPKNGGTSRTLVANVEGATALAVNADAVYCAGLGPLLRVSRH